MARPVWTGTISFGMVVIPIRLVPAVRRRGITFNRIDIGSMSRMRRHEVAEATGQPVPSGQIGKGYDVGNGSYVVITDDDLASLVPARSKEINLESFVPVDEVDPMMFEASYYVVPDKVVKPYALLAEAMAGGARAAIGRFVMHQKEHLALIRSDGRHLMLSTLVFPDEVVAIDSVEEFDSLDGVEVSKRELQMATSLVEALSDEFDPSKYVDEYRLAREAVVESRVVGMPSAVAEVSQPRAQVVDLASALEASLREAKAARGRHPSASSRAIKAAASSEADAVTPVKGTKSSRAPKTPNVTKANEAPTRLKRLKATDGDHAPARPTARTRRSA